MIDKMTKLSFILLSGEEGSLLKKIQEIGLVDITRSSKPVDRESHELYAQADLIYGVVNALDKVKIPSGTPAVPFREDLVNFTGDMISKYVSTSSSLSSLKEELEDVLQWGEIRSEDLRKLNEIHSQIEEQIRDVWRQIRSCVKAIIVHILSFSTFLSSGGPSLSWILIVSIKRPPFCVNKSTPEIHVRNT